VSKICEGLWECPSVKKKARGIIISIGTLHGERRCGTIFEALSITLLEALHLAVSMASLHQVHIRLGTGWRLCRKRINYKSKTSSINDLVILIILISHHLGSRLAKSAKYSSATSHQHFEFSEKTTSPGNLARSRAGDVGALAALDAASDADTRPLPVRASTLGAKNVNLLSLGTDGALDVLDGETGDRDAGGGGASGGAVLVVLLDEDSGLGDVLEGDALVGDVLGILLATRIGFMFLDWITPTLTWPVAPETVLMRTPLSESTIWEFEMVTVSTTLLSRPPTEPMERPWPPEQ
jgi:hypothetical protein